MEKYWPILKDIARGLPYVTLLTAIVYAGGREFNSHYWRAIGLPLMATDRQLADMLYDGFLAYAFWVASLLKLETSPLLGLAIFVVAIRLLYSLTLYAGKLLERWLLRRKTLKVSTAASAKRKAGHLIVGLFLLVKEILDVIGPMASFIFIVCMAILIGLVPASAAGDQGSELGKKDNLIYESRIRQLRDGLVDVSIIAIKSPDGDKVIHAIPIECAGDRCASMTQDGPISLPKDRFLEESVVRAVWTEACLSTSAFRKRQH